MPEWIERDMIAGFETADARAYFDDFAGRLVTEHRRQSRDHSIGAEFPFVNV
jgi:hypothetical protein